MNRKKEIAKFFSGFQSFHALFHGALWVTGSAFSFFGIAHTQTWNLAGGILNGLIALALGFYGWRSPAHNQQPEIRS
jgi:hypothetical protein